LSTTKNKQRLLLILEDLDKKDLEEVVARARFLIQELDPERDSRDGEFFYRLWAQELRDEGYGKCDEFYIFSKRSNLKTYDKKIKDLKVFTEDVFGKLSPVKKAFVHRLYAGLLLSYFKKRTLGVTPNMLISNLHLVPSLFNQAYPGYINAGLALALIRSDEDNENVRTSLEEVVELDRGRKTEI